MACLKVFVLALVLVLARPVQATTVRTLPDGALLPGWEAATRQDQRVPAAFWGPDIASLKPLRVTRDRLNIAVVLAETADEESGVYFLVPTSSNLPFDAPGRRFETQPDGNLRFVFARTPGSNAPLPRVTMTGFGRARIGMTTPALEAALDTRFVPPADEDEVECRHVSPPDAEGVGLMLLDGVLVRVNVYDAGVLTLSGAAVGDTQAAVMARYGPGLVVSNHFYGGPESKYLTLHSADGRYGIRFETDGQVVTSYYAGTAQAIEFVEGCQ